jgi:hypothetical protein
MALRRRLSHASPTPRLSSIWQSRARPPRAPPTSRPGTQRARPRLAFLPQGRSSPGAAWGAMDGGRPPANRHGGPATLCKATRTDAVSGPDALGACLRCATPSGLHDHSGHHPGATCPGRRRLGRPLSRQGQSPSATPTRNTAHRAPGHPWASPGPTVSTRPPPGGTRPPGPCGHRRHRPGGQRLPVGHGPGGIPCRRKRRRLLMIQNTENRATRTDAKVLRQRRSPGVVAASAAFGGLDRALEPRWRQAPDGRPAGGSQPTHSSRSNRRLWLAPSFLMHRGETSMKTEKKAVGNP